MLRAIFDQMPGTSQAECDLITAGSQTFLTDRIEQFRMDRTFKNPQNHICDIRANKSNGHDVQLDAFEY